ncbi:MAG: SDR family NAD(P)-dependent oxidoreductase [Pseudomonadota bacterium]
MAMSGLNVDGKTVVITGGATGIGFALAKAFGARGARICIGEPRQNRLEEAVDALHRESIEADYFVCDVSDPDQVVALADFAFSLGPPVAAIVNNAGIGIGRGSVIDRDLNELRRLFDVNFFGVWQGCAVFGKRFIEQGAPAGIYNVGSENSLFVGVPNVAGYVSSKHAVHGLTDALRDELPEFINVGLICPGFVRSEIIDPSVAPLAMDTDVFADRVVKQIEAGSFYIVTHAYNKQRIDERYRELQDAFAAYAPRYDGDDQYDIRTLLQKMRENKRS